MPQHVSLDCQFDGDVEALVAGVRNGAFLEYNGRPMPVPSAIMEGQHLLLPLPHRLIIIDISKAISDASHGNRVRIQKNFVK
jgi:hypothetical protein